MKVTLLGTGGMLPLPHRHLTSLWLEYKGKACMIDCGEGTQIAVAKQNVKLSHLDVLLITHTHADHISGLPGLLLSLGNSGKQTPVKIYGCKGISQTIRSLMCICPVLPFEVRIEELSLQEKTFFRWNDINISSLPLEHGDVPCLGYSFVLTKKPTFNPQKAKALGIDVKFWKELHAGQTIQVDGRTIHPNMVTDGEKPPIKVTYLTDSRFLEEMVDFAQNSDLLIGEGMYGSDEFLEKMYSKGHMVCSQSAKLARESNSKLLWITHYSPAFSNPQEWTKEIKKLFPKTVMAVDGESIELKNKKTGGESSL